MCLLVYVGAEAPLALIPWNEKAPGFNVEELGAQPVDAEAKAALKHPYVYEIGSTSHCGCDFQYNEEYEPPDRAPEVEKAKGCLRQLGEYLCNALERSPRLELISCWVHKGLDAPPGPPVPVTPEALTAHPLPEKGRFLIVKAVPGS